MAGRCAAFRRKVMQWVCGRALLDTAILDSQRCLA